MASKTQRFRELIEAEEIVIQPGVYDGFNIRDMEQRFVTKAQHEAKYGAAR